MPGHEIVVGEEKNRIRGLFNFSYPVQQSDTAICVDIIVAIERCADDTRRDGVDPDIVGRKFRRKTNGERMHAALGDQRRICSQGRSDRRNGSSQSQVTFLCARAVTT